ncbi:MAG TPA: PRC-barrel domain-containing protein [Phycisphaerales bacterium]|nr:PRC-barrel domain-containing protein [Phycisphaerales bacterium]
MLKTTAAASAAITIGTLAVAHNQRGSDESPRFVSYDTLLDASIKSSLDPDHTADVDDLIVDTRDGQIAYAVVDTNKILGSENRVIAIPYGALMWNPADKQFSLNATAAQIKSLPKIDPKDLTPLSDASWHSTMREIFGERNEFRNFDTMRGDEYSWNFSDAKPRTITGKVTAIRENATTARGASCCAIDIQTDKGEKHTVYLAPIAYLNDHGLVPREGDPVTVSTVKAMDSNGQAVGVARTIKVNDKSAELRDEHGQPDWSNGSAPVTSQFFALATTMDNGSLMSQGQKFGSVSDILCEPRSGSVAFTLVSVGGVLGVDSVKYPVPFSAVNFGRDNNMFINMPVEKLKIAPKLSKDGIEDLNKQEFVKSIEDFYSVQSPHYQFNRSQIWMDNDHQQD